MPRPQRSPGFTALAVCVLLALPAGPARAQAAPPCDPNVSPGCAQPPPAPAPPAYPQAYPGYQPGPVYPLPPPAVDVPSHVEMKPRWGLFSAGLITFGAMYTFSAMIGGVATDHALAIPLAGPFVQIANWRKRFDCGEPPLGSVYYCRQEGTGDHIIYGLLVVDGLVQAGGLALAAAGLFTRHEVRVWDVKMTLLPSVNPQGGGLAAFGVF